MEYSIQELSHMAGVSARTLRYYDEIGLLKPAGKAQSGYRFYGEREVNLLQQILFYRERGLRLEQIGQILYRSDFDALEAMQEHLQELLAQKQRTEILIEAVKKTISSMKGENSMKNEEKFAAFKQKLVDENEARYGQEIREKYGDEKIDDSNRKMMNMTEAEFDDFQKLEVEINSRLQHAVLNQKDPKGQEGKEIALLHQRWIQHAWPKYSAKAHRGLVDMYLADERFTSYYDKEVAGCAAFLNRAVKHWIEG